MNQRSNSIALLAIFVTNIALPLNQFNIASIFSFMAKDFNQNVSGLGLLGSVYFLGVGIAEIPSAIAASRIGSKNMLLIGALMAVIPVIFTSFATNFALIVVLRFVTGLGTGAVFPPMVSLLVRNSRESSAGFGIGLLALTFNLSGIIGLFGWSILGIVMGWRLSLILAGVFGLSSILFLFLAVPKDEIESKLDVSFDKLRKVLFKGDLMVLSLALFGIGAASTLTYNFIVFYLENSVGLRPELAGLIGGLGPICAIVAPFLGRRYDRGRKLKRWVVSSCLLITAGVAITAIGSIATAILSVSLVAIGVSVGFSIGLAASRETVQSEEHYQSLAVGFGDAVSLIGSFVSPIPFSFLVLQYGYPYAWVLGSLFTVVFVLPLVRSRL